MPNPKPSAPKGKLPASAAKVRDPYTACLDIIDREMAAIERQIRIDAGNSPWCYARASLKLVAGHIILLRAAVSTGGGK